MGGPAPIVATVRAADYTVSRRPAYDAIGRRVDAAILRAFPDGRYILRAIGLDDHPGTTLEQLAAIVLTTGTDKYDPERTAVGHAEFSGYDYDIQAGRIEIRGRRFLPDRSDPSPTLFGGIARHFFEGAPIDRGHPVRIDLLLLYDPRRLVRARRRHPHAKGVRRGLDRFLFRFVEPEDKPRALVGLVKILRRAPSRTS